MARWPGTECSTAHHFPCNCVETSTVYLRSFIVQTVGGAYTSAITRICRVPCGVLRDCGATSKPRGSGDGYPLVARSGGKPSS
eukprot:scaffold83626_cov35-Prasinocladus_malaysianus.AAC.2